MTGRPELVRWSAGTTATPLVCFPYAGGRAGMYRHWSRHLGRDVLVPGRDHRPSSLAAIAAGAASAIDGSGLDRCSLFGHSMGAVVALEVAARLQGEGIAVDRLIVAARRPPGAHASTLDRELTTAAAAGEAVLPILDPAMAVMARVLAPAAETDDVQADLELLTAHPAVRSPLPVPIHAVAGADDPAGSPEAMAGWADLTDGRFTLDVVPGAHYFIHTTTAALIDVLRRRLGPAPAISARR